MQISLIGFVPKGLINNESELFKVMVWHQAFDKPLKVPLDIPYNWKILFRDEN